MKIICFLHLIFLLKISRCNDYEYEEHYKDQDYEEAIPSRVLLPPPYQGYAEEDIHKPIWTHEISDSAYRPVTRAPVNYEKLEIPISFHVPVSYSHRRNHFGESFNDGHISDDKDRGYYSEHRKQNPYRQATENSSKPKKLVITLAKNEDLIKEETVKRPKISQEKSSPQESLSSLLVNTALSENVDNIKHSSVRGHKELSSEVISPSLKSLDDYVDIQYQGKIDELYDEFLDVYYYDSDHNAQVATDPEPSLDSHDEKSPYTLKEIVTPTSTESSDKKTHSSLANLLKSSSVTLTTIRNEPPQTELSTKFREIFTTMPITTVSALSKTSTIAKTTSNAPTTTPPSTTTSKIKSEPLSLSEVLQKIGTTLPMFLVSLKSSGVSLKHFNNKLSKRRLSNKDFKRINGDVEKLLEILEESESSPVSAVTASTKERTMTNSTKQKSYNFREKTRGISTTQRLPTTKESLPVIFGSNKNFIPDRLPPTRIKTKQSSNDDDDTTPLPTSTQLNVSSAGISNNNSGNSTSHKSGNETSPSTDNPNTFSYDSFSTLKPYKPLGSGSHYKSKYDHRGIVRKRKGSTRRPFTRPSYVIPSSPRPGSRFFDDEIFSRNDSHRRSKISHHEYEVNKIINDDVPFWEKAVESEPTNPGSKDIATRSAIMAAAVLGSVALSVFIAIFIVVKYKNHKRRRKRRKPFALPSDSSTSSVPPLYATRSSLYRTSEKSNFWDSLKRKFDPYSVRSSPSSM